MARIFTAFGLSDEARDAVARSAAAIGIRDVSVVPRENLHITLAFLGDLAHPDALIDALRGAAAECASAAVRLGTAGGFPGRRRARVLTVEISDPHGALAAAAGRLHAAMAAVPISWRADRPWVPHITIGRARRSPVRAPDVMVEPVEFTIGSVEVMESVLHGGAPPRYVVLASLPFARSSASTQAGVCP